MRYTARDVNLTQDIALSHVLARDQILSLGYFTSVSRANRRLQALAEAKILARVVMPFSTQFLYRTGSTAKEVVESRIANLLSTREKPPQFLEHALLTTEIRLALKARGATTWRYEAQLRHSFSWRNKQWEVRPDGMAVMGSQVQFIETDLGHVNHERFAQKLQAFKAYVQSGQFTAVYGDREMSVITVTTGERRAKRLASFAPRGHEGLFHFTTFEELGITAPGRIQ